jgi:hypothetical protein
VSDMWRRIRSAGKRKWKENIELRYVVVGETGTKFGRCHYHGVVFSSHPIIELGRISGRKTNEFAYKRRLNWSIWGHGFVEFQVADRKGMAYCLKYILKSRMTAARSEGHKREGKTEWMASSYLWCSKVPPVGATWLWEKLNDLISKGMCPPALRIRVPGGGDWYVSGEIQKEMCLYLHQANEEFRKERGRDLAGWSTLVKSVQDEIEMADTGEIVKRKPWEWLVNGEEQEKNTEFTQEEIDAQRKAFDEWFQFHRRVGASVTNARKTVDNCGNIRPCEACRNSLHEAAVADLDQEYILRFEQWRHLFSKGYHESEAQYEARFIEWWQTRLRPSRGCALRDSDVLKDQFRRLVAVTKAQPRLAGRKAVGKAL